MFCNTRYIGFGILNPNISTTYKLVTSNVDILLHYIGHKPCPLLRTRCDSLLCGRAGLRSGSRRHKIPSGRLNYQIMSPHPAGSLQPARAGADILTFCTTLYTHAAEMETLIGDSTELRIMLLCMQPWQCVFKYQQSTLLNRVCYYWTSPM